MSGVIRLLPDHIANQIAAGEVIQRPASVIKELMENAIDSQATKIDVVIKDAGRTLIQVIDNGCGMTPEDAKRCFDRHATSKIKQADDLFALSTKGFRGEALASIAAIAHVVLRTRKADSELGTEVLIEGSTIKHVSEVVAPTGSSFEIKNLFYNVPARRNFLKSDKIENTHILEEFERIVLAHPEVHFTIRSDQNLLYELPQATQRRRIVDLLGKNSNDRLVPILNESDIVRIKGFVLKPEFARRTRGDQYLFVNDRFFKSSYFHNSICKAFDGLLKEQSHPGYFIYLEVNPAKIDVNVHPTKTEIKFEEERYIYSILMSSIRESLGKYNISPSLDFERETSFDLPHETLRQAPREPEIKVNPHYNPFSASKGSSSENNTAALRKAGFGDSVPDESDWKDFYTVDEEKVKPSPALFPTENDDNSFESFLYGDMIFFPTPQGMFLIHRKRCLERLLYDELFSRFIYKPLDSQQLLFPIDVSLERGMADKWIENKGLLEQLGFRGEVKQGNEELSIFAVPELLEEEHISDLLHELLICLLQESVDKGDLAHHLLILIAGNAHFGKADKDPESVKELVRRIMENENQGYSPSGKKIMELIPWDHFLNYIK